jgi:hypothetical protein
MTSKTADPPFPGPSRNIPASAPTNRKNRRALVKALGNRQFKKLYRKAQA